MTGPHSGNRELLDPVHAALARAPAAGPLVVAFSGGSDSSALLHALAHCDAARIRGLRALHVDHGLAARSAEWARHCCDVCARLEVPLRVLHASIQRDGEGLEAAARRARYAALAGALAPDELLLTAHHADDQTETLLLRLLRGAGIHGLAGMREWRALAPGWLGRPWLGVPRASIDAYARAADLPTLVDPSNADATHDRNYLRLEVIPRLVARWPQASAALARSAQLLGDASCALARRNTGLLEAVTTRNRLSLDCAALRALDPFDLEEILRTFVAAGGAPSPPARVTSLLRAEVLEAQEDASPALMWRGFALRRFRDALYLTPPLPPVPPQWSSPWNGQNALVLPAGIGVLHADAHSPLTVSVTFRSGGERMRLRANGPNRPVRLLLQELCVPPWQRDRTPLVIDAFGVAAIGTSLISDRLRDALTAAGAHLRFET